MPPSLPLPPLSPFFFFPGIFLHLPTACPPLDGLVAALPAPPGLAGPWDDEEDDDDDDDDEEEEEEEEEEDGDEEEEA
jgi:hypothetical protein